MNGTGADSVSVVIVTYQSGATLERCLAALKAQSVQGFETILSDNGSVDGAPQAAAARDAGLTLIAHGENLGFAAGNNRAALAASGRWLVLLNPDAYPRPDWLAQLMAAAAANPHTSCFTARQLMAGDPTRLDGLGDAMAGIGLPYRGGFGAPDPGEVPAGEVFSPCGAAMMIDRALFLDLGGFDEGFFCYCEDADLGYRLRLMGQSVRLAPEAVVLHEGSASTGGRRSDFSLYHGARNRFWTFVKNAPPVLLWLTAAPHLAATLLLWVMAPAGGEAAAIGRGLRDAVRGLPAVWAKRRLIQAQRRVSSLAIARMMVWNPLAVARRKGRLKV